MKSRSAIQFLKKASALVMDIDGVLSNGFVFLRDNGSEVRSYHFHDNYALETAVKNNFPIGVITAEKPKGIIKRLRYLGIDNIKSNRDDKGVALKELSKEMKLDLTTTVYVGDDEVDIPPLKLCGIPCCPTNARPQVLAISKYVSPYKGGEGCIRDILEQIFRLQGIWDSR